MSLSFTSLYPLRPEPGQIHPLGQSIDQDLTQLGFNNYLQEGKKRGREGEKEERKGEPGPKDCPRPPFLLPALPPDPQI
jgi:hypothetical protein